MQAIPAKFNGSPVSIIGVNLGWATVLDEKGEERKVRVSKLEVEQPEKLAGMQAAPVRAVKAKAPAKKATAPAKKATAKKAAAKKATAKSDSGRLVNPDMSRYSKYDVKTESGTNCIDVGDAAAAKLRGKTLAEQFDIVAAALTKAGKDTSARKLREKYTHLNVGMVRMNLGNLLRGVMKDKK